MKVLILVLAAVGSISASQFLTPSPKPRPRPAPTEAPYEYTTTTRRTTTTTEPPYVYPTPEIKFELPTTTRRTTTTTRAPVTEKINDAESVGVEHTAGNPYEFTYSVKEDEYLNDYMANQQSDGENVKGEYSWLMPDGRIQIVRYTADWKNGYTAEVTYEGQAKY